ncbi:MAG: class I SAM-dependent methyltransferase [Deltaproteobacteria bacterium]|nr:class I SAM-dependent methyltransferase [Deltaproteobacteria bacterium]
MPGAELVAEVARVLELPRGEQLEAVRALQRARPLEVDERWNTLFGEGSLYDAWSMTTVAGAIYPANRALLREGLSGRSGWRVVEVGGGDGRLWRGLPRDLRGELVLVDPSQEAHDAVRDALPPGVALASVLAPVEAVALPDADAVLCSLTLHHVAGLSAGHRAAHGLLGTGKGEVLRAIAEALRSRAGLLLLNEADVFCDIDLPPGDPVLVDRILDSYLRRTGTSLLHDLARRDPTPDLARRWERILRQWCVDQVDVAWAPLAERDVYELTVPRWRDLLAREGLSVVSGRFTDPYGLFYQYAARPR